MQTSLARPDEGDGRSKDFPAMADGSGDRPDWACGIGQGIAVPKGLSAWR
ncbi:hypothetical protein OH686_14885 [Pseudomonas sp. SO81]|nr:hypothetical protein OH686_14885 [Pseudomonas sp. SO81]